MGLTLVTPPAAEPVTLEEAKAQCRVRDASEDTYIEGLIRSATRHVERTLGLSLITRTYRLTLDAFSDAIELPRGPVSAVTAVQYVDADGVTQTVAPADYSTDLVSDRQWVVLNSGSSWPTTLDAVNAVSVTYTAGFDELPADYEDMKHAILLLTGAWFIQREAVSDKPVQEVPLAVDSLLQPFRRVMV